jgi:hypothetical protein
VPAAVLVAASLRRRYVDWGTTPAERESVQPGDEMLPSANLTATRAITIRAPMEDVWPWIAQLGQGRGGFYSYDALENLAGCDIHSAVEVHPEWQHVEVGDSVRLAPQVKLAVAAVEPGVNLVLRGGIPMGPIPTPYDFIWAFVIRPGPDGTTRLVVRERYRYTRPWAALVVQPAELISCLMSVRMLQGIKKRVERNGHMPLPAAPPRTRVQLHPGSFPDSDSLDDEATTVPEPNPTGAR